MNKPDINVTPLIDVLLVLLIIFMVVTPVKPSQFESKVPSEPKIDGSRPDPRTLVVTIGAHGDLSLNTDQLDATPANASALTERLRTIFRLREANLENEKTVYLKAPKNLDYGSVMKVVDAIKMAGAAPISLQIDRLD